MNQVQRKEEAGAVAGEGADEGDKTAYAIS